MEGLNCRCVLDAEGERLALAFQARPYLIKPNLYELETVVGRKLESLEDIQQAALGFIDQGIQVVAVSMGDRGALITDGEQTLYAPRVPVEVKSTVGAGDSMVAGLIAGLMAELPLQEVFRKGHGLRGGQRYAGGHAVAQQGDLSSAFNQGGHTDHGVTTIGIKECVWVIGVAILGYGTVGSGVQKILSENRGAYCAHGGG